MITLPPTSFTSMNVTTEAAASFRMAKGPVLAAAIFEIMIIIIGTIGNFFTIVAVLRNKNLQYASNYLIVSLAVADFLVSTILVPMRATQHITYQSGGSVPKAFVEVAGFVGRVNIIASISTLVCLSVDRYIALSRPLKYATSIRYNLRLVSLAIATVWLVAIIITSMPKFPGVTDIPFQAFFVGFVLVATAIISAMYYQIFTIVSRSVRGKSHGGKAIRFSNAFQKKPARKVRSETKSSEVIENTAVHDSVNDATTTNTDKPTNEPTTQFSREERKAAKTIGIVIAAFILLVYPRIVMLLYHFDNDQTSTSKVARFWVRVLLYTNSAINPVFYAYRHKGFRKEFKKMGLLCLGLGRRVRERYATVRQTQSQSVS